MSFDDKHSQFLRPAPITPAPTLFNKGATEFIGTLALVMTIATVKPPAHVKMDELMGLGYATNAPWAIGSLLMAAVFMGGHVSGAHYNPAVSLGIYLRNKLSTREFAVYVMCQLLGGIAGALLGFAVTGDTIAPAPGDHYSVMQAFMVEALWTFLLVSVVFNTATTMSNEKNSFYGLAIGFTVASGAATAGRISGAVFNPAVGTGLLLVNAIDHGDSVKWLWLYWLAPIIGAAMAAAVFRWVTNPIEFHERDSDERDQGLHNSMQL